MLKRLLGWSARRKLLCVYAALVVVSHVVVRVGSQPHESETPTERLMLDLPRMNDSGAVPGERYAMSWLRWTPERADASLEPVILLHGCPSGGGSDFKQFAPRLAAGGWVVYAPDLPGSGESGLEPATFSILATARAVLAGMDELDIQRAHVVGWSQGGGSAIHIANLAPQRVRSLTMLASIGTQETEGSGSYWFEQVKYRLGHVLIAWVPELLPHFGLLGSHERRSAMLRPFMDTDLRPMREIMSALRAVEVRPR